jgi:hypothetical protein
MSASDSCLIRFRGPSGQLVPRAAGCRFFRGVIGSICTPVPASAFLDASGTQSGPTGRGGTETRRHSWDGVAP